MCLTRPATETEKRNKFRVQTDLKGRRIGFKVLTNDGTLPFQGTENKLPEGKWINEKRYRYDSDKKSLPFVKHLFMQEQHAVSIKEPKNYVIGFHVFVDQNEAIQYSKIHWSSIGFTIRKVYFRKIVARGYQANSHTERRVIVCKEIALAK